MHFAVVLSAAILAPALAAAAEHMVRTGEIDDRKAVVATVEPVHQLVARARIGGTVVALKTREGDQVADGQELAVVADQKLVLQAQALDARIQSQEATRNQARIDFDRIQELVRRNVASQTQFDQAKTALDVAERNLTAIRTERQVVEQQMREGAVLAPSAGRILAVPVPEGGVVLPGETIATLAEDRYILRLQLPERHAQFMRQGDTVFIGARGLQNTSDEKLQQGRVRLVYPEIRGGRVIADVEVEGLGNYFVGERTRVYVATGKRPAIVIPAAYVYRRAGVNFVRLKDGSEVVVQPGERIGDRIEVLSGLTDGDVVVTP
jgi:RND family efflux transporter MFP subunit